MTEASLPSAAVPSARPTLKLGSHVCCLYESDAEHGRDDDELRRSEEHNRAVFEQAAVGMVVCDLSSCFVRANARFCDFVGYTEAELRGRSFADITHPEHVIQDHSGLQRVVEGEVAHYQAEKRYIRKDGAVVWGRVYVSLVRRANGAPDYFVTVVEDITERRLAEARAVDAERRYHALFDQVPVGVVIIDSETGLPVAFNNKACEQLGYTRDDFARQRIWDYDSAATYEEVVERIARVQSGQRCEFETRHRTATGEIREVRVVAQVSEIAGRPLIHNTFEDITDRKRAEQALRESEERYQGVLQHGGIGVALYDLDGHILLLNERAVRNLGGTDSRQFVGKCLIELFGGEVGSAFVRRIRDVAASPEARDFEDFVRMHNGDRWYSSTHTRLLDANGNVIGVQVFAQDITERKRAEQALRESEERFEKAFQSNPVMLAITSLSDGKVDGRILDANPAWLERLGFTRDEVIGKSNDDLGIWSEVVAIQDGAESLKAFWPARGRHVRVRARDGETFDVVLSVERIELHGEPADLWAAVEVTEWISAERALRESERRFRMIAENTGDVIWTLDPETNRFTYVSPSVEKLRGYTPNEVMAQPLEAALTPESYEAVIALLSTLQSRLEAQTDVADLWINEVDQPRKDGSIAHTEVVTALTRGPDGRPLIVGETRDITERKRMDAALRESEERYRELFEHSPIPTWEEDFSEVKRFLDSLRAQGVSDFEAYFEAHLDDVVRCADLARVVNVNAASLHLLGEQVKTDLPNALAGRTDERWLRKFARELAALASGASRYESEIVAQLPSGEDGILALTVSVPRRYANTLARVLVSFQDITERVRAENALRESEERFRLLVQAANEGIYSSDSDFRATFVNEQMARMLGYDPEEMLGRPLADFVLPEELEDYGRRMSARRLGQGGRYERRLVCRDGRVITCQVSAAPIQDANGGFAGSVGLFTDVTERRLAEDALRESEERYRSLFTEMMAGFALHEILCDDQGKPVDYRFLEINPAFERMTGIRRDTVVGKTVREVLPTTEDYWIESYGRVAITGEPLHYENYARELGKHFEVMAYSPKRGQFAVTFTDVTERRRAEDTLRALAQSAADGGLLEFCRSLVRHLATDLRARWSFIAEVTSPSATQARMLAIWDGADFGTPIEYDLRNTPCHDVLDAGVSSFPHSVRQQFPDDTLAQEMGVESYIGVPLRDSKGEPMGVLVVMSDRPLESSEHTMALLTAFSTRASAELVRARAERALAASEQQYRQIVELVPEGFWVLDGSYVTTFANQTMAEMLGYTVDEMVGKHTSVFRLPGDHEQMLAAMARRRAGVIERHHLNLVGKDGRVIPVRASSAPVFDARGNYAGSVSLIEDLTTQRRLEGERQDLEQRLFQAQKMEAIGSLAGGVAHDFNNMLGIILGHTSLIDMELQPDSPLRDAVRVIDQTCERGSALTRQLLGFARRGKKEEKPFNPATLVEEVAGLVRRTFDRSIVVDTRIESRGWAVVGDPNQIHQALMNMAINSRDAMPNGGRLTLSVGNTTLSQAYAATHPRVSPGRYVVLTVADTGVGMSPEVRDRAFEPFFTTKDVGKGTGLGLASAYGIIDNHGGYIDLDSEPGVGTRFRVYLPAADDVGGGEQPTAASVAMPTGTATILLVDDEPAIREIGKLVLGRLGYHVLTANDGAQALEIFRSRHEEIGLVILDMSMPVMGGRETAKRLMGVNPQCRILLASGYSADGDVGDLLRLENVRFVQKPFRARQLAEAVKEALGGI